jgi:hypothetical protein
VRATCNEVTTSKGRNPIASPEVLWIDQGKPLPYRATRIAEIDVYHWVGPFDDLSLKDRLLVAQLVVDGGAVVGKVKQVAERLKNARTIALLREQGTDRIIGVASHKSPAEGIG